jgi:enoyl-[acyl-carrier protein] reductase III
MRSGFLNGKVAFVTGGSRGIGRATALRLAEESPKKLFIGYCMNREAADQAVAQVEALGVSACALAGDVGQVESIEEMFNRIEADQGCLDVFVSNAARGALARVTELTARSWGRSMDINARAFLLGSQRAARLMKPGGRIVGVSSLGAYRYTPGYAALGAAKAALESVARYLAVELADQEINVNVVCGGLIETEGTTVHPDYNNLKQTVVERTPAKRIGQPEDLAPVIAFLCSPESEWMRGQTLVADGGFSLMN